jgi:hypothetical protein
MHSSHYIDITMVHPLLGYAHKDLSLGSLIMVVLHLQAPRAYSSLQTGKIYMR